MTRIDVEFPSGDDRCAAWLYRPEAAADASVPIVVLAHGLGGVKEMRLDAYAERFTADGYACLVFDYRHFGASEGEPRQLLDIERQLADWAAAVRYARRLDGVDSSRVVLWGSSFSGGHVIEVAARDGRIAAVVSQCPFTDGLASALATPFVSTLKIAPSVVRDVVAAARKAPPVLVPLAAPRGGKALMAADDADSGYRALRPEGLDFVDAVAARFALQITRYFPGRSAKKLSCPALFCVCGTDTVAPARATLRHVEKAPRGEVLLYPYGHFDIYLGDAFETVIADQLAFLRRVVPV